MNITRTSEYCSWQHMKQRCYWKNHDFYHRYGGRGIRVCERWRNSFTSFLRDVGYKPKNQGRYSIDRIDNNGNYSCGECRECKENGWNSNCRWADDYTQQRNRQFTNRGKGITWSKSTQSWQVLIWIQVKPVYFGKYSEKEEAQFIADNIYEQLKVLIEVRKEANNA